MRTYWSICVLIGWTPKTSTRMLAGRERDGKGWHGWGKKSGTDLGSLNTTQISVFEYYTDLGSLNTTQI